MAMPSLFPLGLLLGLSSLLIGCNPTQLEHTPPPATSDDNTLIIWWERGYYLQEDEAFEALVAAWEAETGHRVDLVFIDQYDLLKKAENALQAGTAPDLMYAALTDETLSARWAWEGALAEVSDVIEPVQQLYSPAALQASRYYNGTTQTQAFYTLPIHQQTTYLHYWQTLLDQTPLRQQPIPDTWDAFWAFWQQAQDDLRRQGQQDIYALGLPMSSEASDTHYAFEKVLDAYDVELWDDQGNLRQDDPTVRQGIAQALRWYTDLYKAGYVPPDAIDWENGTNNTRFLNQQTLMVVNPTLSIPASQRENADIYQRQIVTHGFPKEPDGEPLVPVVTVKQVVLFAQSPHLALAKDFLAYLIEPDHLGTYLETALGRYLPVMPTLSAAPFWNDASDPHVFSAIQQLKGDTKTNAQTVYLASASVWGTAIERVLVDGLSPEAATEEAWQRLVAIAQTHHRP